MKVWEGSTLVTDPAGPRALSVGSGTKGVSAMNCRY